MNYTKIKHYRNSFLDIYNSEIRIWMDPWVNTAFNGLWASCNAKKFLKKEIKTKPVDFIYISHLHPDHFDIKFLQEIIKFQKKEIKFLIKKFKDSRLSKILQRSGIKNKNIIEVDSFQTVSLSKKSKFIILPQLSSSYSHSDEVFYYDLDTSCIFIDDNVRVFNQVDNPYSEKDLITVFKKLKEKNIQTSFDLAFLSYCGSSEYPCSFFKLNRKKEKENIINKQLDLLKRKINVTNCKLFIPAGGTYKFDTFFSKLNKYLPIPNIQKIMKRVQLKNDKTIIDTNKYFFIAYKNHISKSKNYFSYFFKSHHNKNEKFVTYNKAVKNEFNIKSIKNEINDLENKLPEKIKKKYAKLKTEINFEIYNKQPVKLKNITKYSNKLNHKISFYNGGKKKKIKLVIHMYYKTFLAFCLGKINFNTLQQHFLYERYPNVYEPDALFFLNFYKNFKN